MGLNNGTFEFSSDTHQLLLGQISLVRAGADFGAQRRAGGDVPRGRGDAAPPRRRPAGTAGTEGTGPRAPRLRGSQEHFRAEQPGSFKSQQRGEHRDCCFGVAESTVMKELSFVIFDVKSYLTANTYLHLLPAR